MNQILVSEKLIVTPEIRRKKKLYKFNFFLCVFLACTLFSYCIYAEYDRNKSEQVSQEILLSLQETDDEEPQADNTTISVKDNILVVHLKEEEDEVIDNAVNENEVDVSNLLSDENESTSQIKESVSDDGVSYYSEAVLSIPSIGIEYPVLSNTSDELLKISLNRLWGPKPNEVGNYVIVGHNYKSGKMFGKLSLVSIGDTFTLKDLSNRTITYKVYDKKIVEPTDVSCTSQLTNGKKEVTLITCKNYGAQRLVCTYIVTKMYRKNIIYKSGK